MYWWFYGMQHSCNTSGIGPSGRHHGDWERVMIILMKIDHNSCYLLAAWRFFYTRIAGPRDASCTGGEAHGRCGENRLS